MPRSSPQGGWFALTDTFKSQIGGLTFKFEIRDSEWNKVAEALTKAGALAKSALRETSLSGQTRMTPDDIYVQVTATSEVSGRCRSVVVLVPGKTIEDYKSKPAANKYDDQAIARHFADPLVRYIFTHRSTLGSFTIAHSFSATPPPEIEREPPDFKREDLKAWLL